MIKRIFENARQFRDNPDFDLKYTLSQLSHE
jgi:hypothetical protein